MFGAVIVGGSRGQVTAGHGNNGILIRILDTRSAVEDVMMRKWNKEIRGNDLRKGARISASLNLTKAHWTLATMIDGL